MLDVWYSRTSPCSKYTSTTRSSAPATPDRTTPAGVRRGGPARRGRAGAETGSGADSESTDGTGSGRGRFAKLAVASVVVSVVATVAARRLAGRGADPEFDADGLDDVQPAPSAAETAEETDRVAGPSGARDE
ncbi:hypothetical protein ACFQL4_01845 [Halosimplex aquaticum]